MNALPAISAKNVVKIYGSGATAYQALRGVNMHVEQGEFVFLSGPSGSGKTTLLSIFGCVLTLTEGSVQLFGEELAGKPDKDLPRMRLSYIGFIFQSHNLIASLTAQENVALSLRMRGYSPKNALIEAGNLLDSLGLADKMDSKPAQLSGGQKQRVAIGRALAGAPPLILADEPTASLDAANGLIITESLKNLAKQHRRTVVVVTHDNRIFHLADRIIQIEDGKIIGDP